MGASLKLAAVDAKAALYAVTHWHYSKSLPAGRAYRLGVWEDRIYRGVIIFSHGGAPQAHMPFGLEKHEVCELTRVAIGHHKAPVSRLLGIAIRLLRRHMPNMRVIVSYADGEQGHHGGIYQATNWAYLGTIVKSLYVIHGKRQHSRNIEERYKGKTPLLPYLKKHIDPLAKKIQTPPKHKYALGLDASMIRQLSAVTKPYPKRAASIGNDAAAFQAAKGGATPTAALHSIDASNGTEKVVEDA